ncbi:hypothetical protein Aeh1hmmORF04c [Aeromonas phage Aeh1]|uniref:Uncharacterized protein n=1 Tax=Aeromonas phage Aeh1 TaxID=2880362 RepID=Q76YG0_9CAUD|nr:hypothetical protein Aeh1p285 [Aeromonas phage Aeh1]AAQ17935.1 hypothetical protein Aeh1hmmORF04c [Aeromonas phage Aeh1]
MSYRSLMRIYFVFFNEINKLARYARNLTMFDFWS